MVYRSTIIIIMKHNKKAIQSINVLCATLGIIPVYSDLFPSAAATVVGKTGIASLDGVVIKKVIGNPYFSKIRAGFMSGTLVIEFQTLV